MTLLRGFMKAFQSSKKRPRWYVLRARVPVPCPTMFEWAELFESVDRRVAFTEVGDVQVSTVFLGLDHALEGPPLLFETMVFGGTLDQEQVRYSTWDEAEAGHQAMLQRVRAAQAPCS